MTIDIMEFFSGPVEVDEPYLGGQSRNNRKSIRDQITRGRGIKKQPVFGILYRNGTVRAEGVDDVTADSLQPLLSQKGSTSSVVRPDTRKAYTDIAARGYGNRLVNLVNVSNRMEKETISPVWRGFGIT